MLLISQAQRDELRRSVLDMNAYAASGQAAAVLYQLREYGEAIERAAADPDVKAITSGPHRAAAPVPGSQTSGNPCSVQTELEDNLPLRRYAEGFSTMVVLDADSCSRARISEEPASLDYIQRRFEWRDYFNGARDDAAKQRRKSYVRKAYRSSVSQLIKFAVSTSLFEGDKWIGVVSGSITAASTLQLPRVKRVETDDRLTALLGPFEGEIDDPSKSDRPEYTLLVHPRLGRGQKVTLPPNRASELDGAFRETPERMDQFELATSLPLQRSDYVDPLLEDRWLAAFAPVGRTGYVVLVQTRDAVAVRPSSGLRQLAVGLIAMSAAILLAWAGFFLWRRQREREALKPLVSRRG